MARRPKAVMSWSSGKDSAFAIHEARRSGDVEIVGILTTVTAAFARVNASDRSLAALGYAARVSMHGVREELLDR